MIFIIILYEKKIINLNCTGNSSIILTAILLQTNLNNRKTGDNQCAYRLSGAETGILREIQVDTMSGMLHRQAISSNYI